MHECIWGDVDCLSPPRKKECVGVWLNGRTKRKKKVARNKNDFGMETNLCRCNAMVFAVLMATASSTTTKWIYKLRCICLFFGSFAPPTNCPIRIFPFAILWNKNQYYRSFECRQTTGVISLIVFVYFLESLPSSSAPYEMLLVFVPPYRRLFGRLPFAICNHSTVCAHHRKMAKEKCLNENGTECECVRWILNGQMWGEWEQRFAFDSPLCEKVMLSNCVNTECCK